MESRSVPPKARQRTTWGMYYAYNYIRITYRGPTVPKQSGVTPSSTDKGQTYVCILLHNYNHAFSKRDVCLDGSDMRAGDGAFINSSCSPNAKLHPCYLNHDESLMLRNSKGRVESVTLRHTVLLFRPFRYVI